MPSPPPLIQVGVVESHFFLPETYQVDIIRTPQYQSFEVICILIKHSSISTNFISIYRPLASTNTLFVNFQVFLKSSYNSKKTFTCLASSMSTLIYQV